MGDTKNMCQSVDDFVLIKSGFCFNINPPLLFFYKKISLTTLQPLLYPAYESILKYITVLSLYANLRILLKKLVPFSKTPFHFLVYRARTGAISFNCPIV